MSQPTKNSETTVFGNSAASTYWKHSSCNEREPPLPNMMSQPTKNLWPVCLAIARLQPNESTVLAMKESHLFPTWWANPQKTSETSVFGNSAASTDWKHSSCNEREPPLPNMMSQEPTHKKPLKPVCLAIVRLRPNESTALAMKESHREVIRGKVQKQAKVAIITARHWRRKEAQHTSIQASSVPPPGCKTHPPGIERGSRGSKLILHHYATGAYPKWREKAL